MSDWAIGPTILEDLPLVRLFRHDRWGGESVGGHHSVRRPANQQDSLAMDRDRFIDLPTDPVAGDVLEPVTNDNASVGTDLRSVLLQQLECEVIQRGCASVWMVPTNEKLKARRFSQKRGYQVVNVEPTAVDRDPALKPTIPLMHHDGILFQQVCTLTRWVRLEHAQETR